MQRNLNSRQCSSKPVLGSNGWYLWLDLNWLIADPILLISPSCVSLFPEYEKLLATHKCHTKGDVISAADMFLSIVWMYCSTDRRSVCDSYDNISWVNVAYPINFFPTFVISIEDRFTLQVYRNQELFENGEHWLIAKLRNLKSRLFWDDS